MRQVSEISRERQAIAIMVELTSAFEGIASMHIAQIKDQVQSSEKFFADLWRIYTQIRVGELFHFGRAQTSGKVIDKELLILITSEGGLSGDIDQKLINQALKHYKLESNDILVVGHHGAVQLAQNNIGYTRSFKMPERDQNINVSSIVTEVLKYASTTVYYQSYVSLMNQDVKNIKLSTAVAEKGKKVSPGVDIISESNYIFEPSTYAVVDHLERSMIQIMLGELILESKLAQYASRFRAMSMAHEKADESLTDLIRLYNHAKRHTKDERLKEIMNGLRRAVQ